MQKELRERAKPLRPRKKNGRGLKFVWRREREKGETAGSPLSAAKKKLRTLPEIAVPPQKEQTAGSL